MKMKQFFELSLNLFEPKLIGCESRVNLEFRHKFSSNRNCNRKTQNSKHRKLISHREEEKQEGSATEKSMNQGRKKIFHFSILPLRRDRDDVGLGEGGSIERERKNSFCEIYRQRNFRFCSEFFPLSLLSRPLVPFIYSPSPPSKCLQT